MESLTQKQKKFCEEYLVDLNATQSAIRAGYSPKTARAIGQENLSKPDIAAYISKLREAQAKRTRVTSDQVIRELAKGAFLELDPSEMKFSDKIRCLELLCKYLGLLDGKAISKEKDDAASMSRLREAISRIGMGSRGALKT